MHDTERSLSDLGLQRINGELFPTGAVLYAMYASVGECSMAAVPVTTSQAILGIVPTGGLDPVFLYYALKNMQAEALRSGQQGTQTNLNKGMVQNFRIPYPELDDQRAIARALGDVDSLVEHIERLILKNRWARSGVLTELLQGRRLPGFSGPWEERTFESIFHPLRSVALSRAQLTSFGECAYIHYGDIHTRLHTRISADEDSLPMASRALVGGASRLQAGDLVVADASEDLEGVGKSVEILDAGSFELVAGLHTIALRPIAEDLSAGFAGLLQYTREFQDQVGRLAAGLKVYGLPRTSLKSIVVPVPPPDEQSAIVEVVSDMDDEIGALQRRLEKTRDLATGVAQALLTGRTRLA